MAKEKFGKAWSSPCGGLDNKGLSWTKIWRLRQSKDGLPFVTDCGHWIIDAALGRIDDPKALAQALSGIPGVMEHGLFIGLAQTAILAGPDGVKVVERP